MAQIPIKARAAVLERVGHPLEIKDPPLDTRNLLRNSREIEVKTWRLVRDSARHSEKQEGCMNRNISYANTATPTPGGEWLRMSDDERLDLVKRTLAMHESGANNTLLAIAAKPDGQVMVKFTEPLGADRRGTVLLDIEGFLKEAIDPGLAVWLEPLGDRNSLRNLRGIEVKS